MYSAFSTYHYILMVFYMPYTSHNYCFRCLYNILSRWCLNILLALYLQGRSFFQPLDYLGAWSFLDYHNIARSILICEALICFVLLLWSQGTDWIGRHSPYIGSRCVSPIISETRSSPPAFPCYLQKWYQIYWFCVCGPPPTHWSGCALKSFSPFVMWHPWFLLIDLNNRLFIVCCKNVSSHALVCFSTLWFYGIRVVLKPGGPIKAVCHFPFGCVEGQIALVDVRPGPGQAATVSCSLMWNEHMRHRAMGITLLAPPPFDVWVSTQMTVLLLLRSMHACAQLPLPFYFVCGEEKTLHSAFELERSLHTSLMAIPNMWMWL